MAVKQTRGFDVPCPKCQERCSVSIDIDDFETCRCGGCDEEFTIAEVRSLIGEWTRFLDWLDRALPSE